MFKRPFSFKGRIRRTEFVLTYLIYGFGVFLMSLGIQFWPSAYFILLGFGPLLWLFFAQASKRCHDRGNPAGYMFIPFYALWMIFADSEVGENKYGQNPKGIGNYSEIDQIGNHLTE